MAMQRIEDMSALEIEATFGDYFEEIPKKEDAQVMRFVTFEEFAEKTGGIPRGELNIICAGGRTK